MIETRKDIRIQSLFAKCLVLRKAAVSRAARQSVLRAELITWRLLRCNRPGHQRRYLAALALIDGIKERTGKTMARFLKDRCPSDGRSTQLSGEIGTAVRAFESLKPLRFRSDLSPQRYPAHRKGAHVRSGSSRRFSVPRQIRRRGGSFGDGALEKGENASRRAPLLCRSVAEPLSESRSGKLLARR